MNKIKNFLIKREQSQACLSFAKREKSRLLAKTILTLVALLAVTTGAWATDAYEEFTTTASWTSYDQTADHFRVTGSYGFPQGLSIGTTNNYSITIAALNSETISKVEMTIGDMGSWNDGNVISSTAGSVSGSYAVNGTITVDNPNASTVTLSAGERYLLIKTLKVYYTEGSSASAVTVAWNKTTKTGTFTMPGGNVELEPEYYPQAALTAAPTAINDVPATTDGAIVNAGTVANIGETANAQGTVMYYVSTTALDDAALLALAADAWKADVPTAASFTAAGTAYVYYYVRGNDSNTDDEIFSDGDILASNALTVTIAAEPTYAVTFKAANANTIEAGKATVTVGGTAATVTEGKLEGVKMGSEVKMTAKQGYKFRKVEAKKGGGEPVLLTTITAADNSSFKSGSQTFGDVATVTLTGDYLINDGSHGGWYCQGSNKTATISVAEANGANITSVKFYTAGGGSAEDKDAPFEVTTTSVTSSNITTYLNGNSIGSYGVSKIEVYGTK